MQSEARRRPRKPRRAGARLSKSAKRARRPARRRKGGASCTRVRGWGVARDRERASARWGAETRWRTSSGAGSSCEPARMASSALTVLSASDSDAAHRVARRADPTEALETRPSAWRTAAADARRAATRGRAAVATTTGFRAIIAGFMFTTSGVPRTRGASGSDEVGCSSERLTWQHLTLTGGRPTVASWPGKICEVPRTRTNMESRQKHARACLGATMMREGGPAYENATDGFDGIDMEAANRRATRRVSTTNAVLGGCVPSSRNDATTHR